MTYKEFALIIKEKRLDLEIKQKDISYKLGISLSKYSKIENGVMEPNFFELTMLFDILDIDPSILKIKKSKIHFFD